jgi:cytochrome c oxidase cbb3-type subunit 3
LIAEAHQAQYLERIAAASLDEIAQEPELSSFALAGGAAAFADNCAPCHGLGGAGQGFYPSLADDDWIWGGTLDDIHTTLLYGIRSGHDDTRFNEMPAFGAMEILSRAEIDDVVEHVLSLSGRSENPDAAARGAELYVEQCAACHGDQGEGVPELGGPALGDAIWLYGDSKGEIVAQVSSPRHGVMPAWVGRLDPDTIKIVTVYVHSLGGGQ